MCHKHHKEYFIDTSALFKRYVQEKGSDILEEIFNIDADFFISSVTPLEVVSNLRRLVDVDKLLSEEEFVFVKGMFLHDVADKLEVVDFTSSLLVTSLELCMNQYITPLDAIQLASALEMAEKPCFVCSDLKLLRLAEEHGLFTVNPAG